MKTKWYFFLLTIIAVSTVLYGLQDFQKEEKIDIGIVMVGENRYQKFVGLKEGIAGSRI